MKAHTFTLMDRRPERVCRELTVRTLKDLARKRPARRAEGLRVLLVVLRQHPGCPAALIEEVALLLQEAVRNRNPDRPSGRRQGQR